MANVGLVAFNMCCNTLLLVSIFIFGTAQSILPIVSVYYQEKDYNGVEYVARKSLKIVTAFGIFFTVLFTLFPQTILCVFSVSDPSHIPSVMDAVRIFSFCLLAFSINFLYMFYLQSIQNIKLSNIVTLLNGLIFPVAFDYSPLEPEQKKSVLDFCTRELLTPKGLRTLSPKSGGYNPIYAGAQTQRDYAYHSGTAWPWLGGFYMEACLKVYKRTRLSFVQRQMLGYEDEMQNHVVGSISELFDGNPPYHGRGAGSFAMNVAEILRTWRLIDQYKV